MYIPENSYGTGQNASQNSGRFVIRELRPPQGYFLNDSPAEFAFTYDGQKEMVFEHTCRNKATTVDISKRELTGDEELPGATLTIQNEDGETVRQWVSGSKPVEIRGLHLDEVYTLTEKAAPSGYAIAESIRFKLVQCVDNDGTLLDENDVYVWHRQGLAGFRPLGEAGGWHGGHARCAPACAGTVCSRAARAACAENRRRPLAAVALAVGCVAAAGSLIAMHVLKKHKEGKSDCEE